jgi:hypothetical protein
LIAAVVLVVVRLSKNTTHLHPAQQLVLPKMCDIPFPEDKHAAFILGFAKKYEGSFEELVTEHLKMEGIFWSLSAMEAMGRGDEMDKAEIIEFVQSCLHDNGGYGGNVGHDPTIVYVAIPKSCDWSRRLSMTDDALVVFPGTRGAPSRFSHYAMRWIESTGTRWPPTSPTCSRLVTDVHGD